MSPELRKLLDEAKADYAAMTPEEKEVMHKTQRESYVRAEMDWPMTRIEKEKLDALHHS